MMQSDDVFCEMINSIKFLNMSKTGMEEAAHMSHVDSGFNSSTEVNTDNIFFYEDSCSSLSNINIKSNSDDADCMPSTLQLPNYDDKFSSETLMRNHDKGHNDTEFTQIQVNVGIDEDLKMILEMDPSLMDVTLDKAVEPTSHVVECPIVLGLPPKG
jgi:hypothetical protein